MLDIKRIKENPEAVKAGLRAKEVDCDAIIDKKGENGIAKFENGITVEELGKYFSYIGSAKDY